MFLKGLELFGFKSFAERTQVEFTDGISALLGPNGCGKSNVVDAIKWVLGEQAVKSLRADKMEDVIFNGTESRKALNVAEVSLRLSNEPKIINLDLDEIVVKRRLFRNGDSEYFINNAPAKLKDVRELFYDTGIGKSAYSIMEQGKIDQVLSNKPEERRSIFEEAASITRHKIKGQDAERKLQRTEENMRQVEQIIAEVKRSYDNLKRQADQTKKYRELKEESFTIDLDFTLLRLRELLAQRDARAVELKEATEGRDTLKAKIDKINEAVESSLDQVNTMESSLIEAQKRIYGIDVEKSGIDNQIGLLKERTGEITSNISNGKQQEAGFQSRIAELAKVREKRTVEVQEQTKRIEELTKNISEFQRNIELTQSGIHANSAQIQKQQQAVADWEAGIESLQRELQAITDDIVAQLDEGLKASGYTGKGYEALTERFRSNVKALEILLQGRQSLLGDLHDSNADAKELQRQVGLLKDSMTEAVSLVQALGSAGEEILASAPKFLDTFLAPEGIITKKRGIDARLEELRANIGTGRAEIERLTELNRELAGKTEGYKKTLEELRMSRVEADGVLRNMKAEVERLASSAEELNQAIRQVQHRIVEDEGRLAIINSKLEEHSKKKAELEKDEKRIKKELESLEKTISTKNSEMISRERDLKVRMQELGKFQARVEKVQVAHAESVAGIRNLYDNFRERFGQELAPHESRMLEIKQTAEQLRNRAAKNRDDLKSLGSVNLMAPEEFAEVAERYEFLTGQLKDLQQARQDLVRITDEIRSESQELFTATFEKIRRNFHSLFRRLFGGGRAELKLADPDNVLESGIDILAQPPGKRLESINLLSGGERSLTAVALLFATYMVKPSPFCLLDEIDAALDENNVGRFVQMLAEFGESSQFIVITHNKKTVAAARTLLGVTMEESGVSKLVAVRIGQQPAADTGAGSA